MDDKLNNLLVNVNDEVERKCHQIKERKKDEKNKKIFAIACLLLLTIPFLLILIGINIITILVPVVVFLVISMIVLSPIVLNNLN